MILLRESGGPSPPDARKVRIEPLPFRFAAALPQGTARGRACGRASREPAPGVAVPRLAHEEVHTRVQLDARGRGARALNC